MKKGVAVPYIIALVLGIAVIGLLGYWFFVLGGRLGGQLSEKECRAKQIEWCSMNISGEDMTRYNWDEFAPGCSDINFKKPTNCKELLGITTPGEWKEMLAPYSSF